MPVDEPPGRDGHDEIAQIGGDLYERRLRDGDVESVLKMLVQHVEDGPGEAPQEEERRDEDERQQVLPAGKSCVWFFHEM